MPCIQRCLLLFSLGFLIPAAAHAQETEAGSVVTAPEFDTEHIFGFSEGSDIGPEGEWEIESVTIGGFGALGSHLNADNATSVHYSVTDDLRLSVGTLAEYHTFHYVPGPGNRSGAHFSGIFTEVRWKLLNRLTSPFGMTLTIDPEWRRIDSLTGQLSERYGVTAALLIDKELVPEKLFTVLNLVYSPSFLRLSGGLDHTDAFAIIAGGSYAITPDLFFGAEIRHENLAHNGLLDAHALYIGPQLFVRPAENINVKIAWAAQIPDFAARTLDLANFARDQVELQLSYGF